MKRAQRLKEREVRKAIFKQIRKFYQLRKLAEKFEPGKSKIPYAGRIYDERELVNLVDASLDFWLTAGRYAKEFEKEFARLLGMKYCFLTNSGSSAGDER